MQYVLLGVFIGGIGTMTLSQPTIGSFLSHLAEQFLHFRIFLVTVRRVSNVSPSSLFLLHGHQRIDNIVSLYNYWYRNQRF